MNTAAAPATRRLYRRPDVGVVGGVASGIAEHLGVPVRPIRIAFVVACFAAGLGIALYGAYWIVVPTDPDAGPPRLPRPLEYVAAAVAVIAAVVVAAKSVPSSGFFLPALLACFGGALIWRQASDDERSRLRVLSRSSLTSGSHQRLGRVRLALGSALVIAGGVVVLARADVTAIRDGSIAIVVALVGVGLITGPWWVRLVTQLSAEREARVRSQERADIAAQLHDSVLQTLALIQRNADTPREVARLARGQERDLRRMLYDNPAAQGQFADRLTAVAAEVEDAYAISIDVVVVGAAELDDHLQAVASAAREALVNAAKHSGVDTVSLFAEIEPGEVNVFVRDRGAGFDVDEIAEDRQGVRGSIIGRVERHGGSVRLRSSGDTGTEVAITMPFEKQEGRS